jgi:putative hydrolase of the HAD superfamily
VPLLLCDLDDTLIDRSAIIRDWANEFASAHALDNELAAWLILQDGDGYRARDEMWTSIKERLGLDDPVEQLIREYRRQFIQLIRCEESVVSSLTKARATGWSIAIVTNGEAFQYEKVNQSGLAPLVDAVCVSDLEGCRKPDPRLFQLAAERCGSSLDGAWMIGDNSEADIGGATACGIKSSWLSLGRSWPAELEYQPTRIAHSFAEAAESILQGAK